MKIKSEVVFLIIIQQVTNFSSDNYCKIWKKYKTIKNLRQATLEDLKEILPTNVAENVLELIGQKTNDNN